MKRLKIEPVTNEYDIKTMNKISFKDLSLENDFLFSAYINSELKGYIHLCPVQNNGLIIKEISYSNNQIAKQLLVEALKCGWEFGFNAAITTLNNPIFKEEGFHEPAFYNGTFKTTKQNILAFPLTFNGIDKYFDTLNQKLNKSA